RRGRYRRPTGSDKIEALSQVGGLVPFHTVSQFIWVAANVLVCGFALWKGGWPERITALTSLIASRASALAENLTNWVDPQWGVFGIDAAFFALLLIMALRTNRTWLL